MAGKTVTYRLSADIAQFRAQMSQASASVKKLATDSTAATKEGAKFRAGLDQLGGTAGKIGLVAAAGLGAAVVTAANFEQSMSAVAAATGESAVNMARLREAAIQAGADTAFSAREAADGVEQLAKAGVSTNDILSGGLNGALDLAAAGSIEVGDAAEFAAKAMTQFGLSGEEVPHIADLLAAAAGKAVGEVSDFGAALSQSGLVADQLGLSLEETTGGLAAFASAGLLGSDAGTSFKATLNALTPNSEKAAVEMERLGISAFDASGNFVGLAEFAGVLQSSLGDLTDEQRASTLETIFGSDAVRAASVLYDQGEAGIRQWTAAVDDQGFAAETAATRLDNLRGDLEALQGSLETALIGAGTGSQGPLRQLVQGATDAVNVFNKLPSSAQNAATGLLAITAVTGGAAWFGSKVISGVATTKAALADLGVSAATTQRTLSTLGKGIQFVAIIEGLKLLDSALDNLMNTELDGSNLDRSLEALSQNRVEGTIFETYGADLKGFVSDLDIANSKIQRFANGPLDDLIPGDSALDEAEANIKALDDQLASLVESGNAEQAAAAFDRLAAAAERQGYSVEEVGDQFEQYGIAVRNSEGATGGVASLMGAMQVAAGGLTGGLKGAAGGFDEATRAGQRFKGVLEALNGFLDKRSAVRGYEQAIDDFTKSVRANGRSMDVNSQKGRDNQAALDGVASAAAQVADQLKGANRVRFMQQAADEIRQRARDLGLPKAATQELINKLREADNTKVDPKVTVDTGGALAAIEAVRARMAAVQDKTVTLTVRRVGGPQPTLADGGVLERAFADGGSYGPAIGDQSPQIRGYTGVGGVTWSEEGSGPWEAFISGHPGKAPRSQAIAAEVVSRLGGQVQWFANGGVMGAAPNVTVNPNVTATASVSDAAARVIGLEVARQLVPIVRSMRGDDLIGAQT